MAWNKIGKRVVNDFQSKGKAIIFVKKNIPFVKQNANHYIFVIESSSN